MATTRAPGILMTALMLVVAACGGSTADTTDTSSAAAQSTTTTSVTSTSAAATTTIASPATTAPTCAPTEGAPDSPGEWGSYGFDDSNSRHNSFETHLGPGNVACLEELWSITDIANVTGTPVVIDEIVYFADWEGWLHSVEAQTGSVVWEAQVAESSISATVLVTEDRIYVPDVDGFLHARDRDTGSAVWSVDVNDQPGALIAAPVLVDGMVILGVSGDSPFSTAYRGSVVAVDAATGAERWRVEMTDENTGPGVGVWTAGAVDRDLGLVFFGTGNTMRSPVSPLSDALVAIDYETGELAWANQLNPDDRSNQDIGASPNLFSIDGRDVVGVGAKNGLFKVVDRETGDEVWSVTLTSGGDPGGVMNTAAVSNGVVYVAANPSDSPGSITFALDGSDGSTLWEQPIPNAAFGSLTVANGIVYQGTVSGTIYALDAGDGSVLWSDELPNDFGDGISVAGGMLFVGYGLNYGWLPSPTGGIVAYSLP